VLERVHWDRDLFIFANVSQDTLDYTGPSVNKGSKALLMGLGKEKIRELPGEFMGTLPTECVKAEVYLPGTLVVQGVPYTDNHELAAQLAQWEGLGNWPFVLVVDDIVEATSSMQEFLWTFFTRFEPANDIYAAFSSVRRFHVGLRAPIVIDCRMKPWYTEVLEVDASTRDLVDEKIERIIPARYR